MIEISNLSFSYGRHKPQILSDVSLQLERGRIYGLLGPNGAGKSTLLYLMVGALTPDSGEVTMNGINTRRRLPSTLADIFIVPEEFSLPDIRLDKFVKLNAPLYPNFSRLMMESGLELFDMEKNPHLGTLSMGQKKKVFMAYALACNTSLLLMDEPTNGLDIPGKSIFRKFIANSMTDDRTILISTHQVADINRMPLSTVIPTLRYNNFHIETTESPIDTLLLSSSGGYNGNVNIDSAEISVIKYLPDNGTASISFGNTPRLLKL